METKQRSQTLAAQHKRIVVNLKTGQTVNLGKRFGIGYGAGRSVWKAFYNEQSCKDAIRDLGWLFPIDLASPFAEPNITPMDFTSILNQNGKLLPSWVDVNDPAYPHKEIKTNSHEKSPVLAGLGRGQVIFDLSG